MRAAEEKKNSLNLRRQKPRPPLTFSSLMGKKRKGTEIRTLLVGCEASGKTTILYSMKLGEVVTTIPTIGFNVEQVEHGGSLYTLWDVGGQPKIRPLWRHYYQDTSLILFCIDANDPSLFQDAKDELMKIFDEECLKDIPLIVIANKQDLPKALKPAELERKLNLQSYYGANRSVKCVGTCAIMSHTVTNLLEEMDTILEPDLKKQQKRRTVEDEEFEETRKKVVECVTWNTQYIVESMLDEYCCCCKKNCGALSTGGLTEIEKEKILDPAAPKAIEMHRSSGEKILFPADALGVVASFLDFRDLLPSADFHFRKGKNVSAVWFTSKTFLYCCLSEAMKRLAPSEVYGSYSDLIMPCFLLNVPGEFVSLHLALCSLLVVISMASKSPFPSVMRSSVKEAFPRTGPYGLVLPAAFTFYHTQTRRFNCDVKDVGALMETLLMPTKGSRMDEILTLFGETIGHIFTQHARGAEWLVIHGQELAPIFEEDSSSMKQLGSDEMPIFRSVTVRGPNVFGGKEALRKVAAIIESGCFTELIVEDMPEMPLERPILQALFKILTGQVSSSICKQIEMNLVPGNAQTALCLMLIGEAGPAIEKISLEIVGKTWKQALKESSTIVEGNLVASWEKRWEVIDRKSDHKIIFWKGSELGDPDSSDEEQKTKIKGNLVEDKVVCDLGGPY